MTIKEYLNPNIVCWKAPEKRLKAPKSDIPKWRDPEQGRAPEKPRRRLWGALTPEAQGYVIFIGAALLIGVIAFYSCGLEVFAKL